MCDKFQPFITTIIPTYQRPRLLHRAIKSVLDQTFPNFQVCVYDDASGDETHAVVKEMAKRDPRIRYFCHPENLGMIRNQIDAMKQVETPFFSFLHDDDILLPNFYEAALEGFRQYPEAMLSACVTLKQDQRGKTYRVTLRKWEQGIYYPPESLMKMLQDGIPHWSAILFRREVLKMLGTLDEQVGLYFDHDFIYRIAVRFPIFISKVHGSIFTFHGFNYGSFSDEIQQWSSILNMVKNITWDGQISQGVKDSFNYWLRRRFRKQFRIRSLLLLKQREFAGARQCAEVLSHLGWQREASFVSFLTTASKYTPLPACLTFFYEALQFVRRLRWNRGLAFPMRG